MKKTLALLLAFAGIASAATEIDLTGKWDGNTAAISGETFTDGKASFVVSLDIDKLASWTPEEGKVPLAYLGATNTYQQDIKLGLSIDTYNSGIICPWKNRNEQDTYKGVTATLPIPDKFTYSYATLLFTVYTDGNNSLGTGYLYLFDDKLEVVDYTMSENCNLGTTILTGIPYSSFTIDSDYVIADSVAVYNGHFSTEDEMKAALKSVLPAADTTVPEPATATLSLLALAGLAARRRRK